MNTKKIFLFVVTLLAASSFAQTKMELAEQAMDNNDYAAVIQYTTDHLKNAPNDANALVTRAYAFIAQNDDIAALADINTAIKYWNKKCSVPLGNIYCIRGLIYENLDEEKSALNDYNTAIKKDNKNASCYVSRAKFYYKHQMYAEAEADFRKAYEIDTKDSENEIEVARCLIQQNKANDAAIILDRIIKYEPKKAEAKRLRACIYFNTEDYKAFVDMYIAYLALEQGDLDMLLSAVTKEYAYVLKVVTEKMKTKNDEERYYWLGVRARVYQKKEQYQEALTDLNTMKSLLSDTTVSSFILFYSAECHYALYEYAEAAELYSKLIELASDGTYANPFRYRRADCYANLGKHQQAVSDFSVIIENDVDAAPSAYYGRGIVKEVLKDFEGALEDYNKGLLLDENDRSLRMMRGRLYLLQKQDTIRANADFNKILELDTIPENSCRQYALMYMGKHDEAIEWNKKILEADPSAGNYYDAACLYSRMNKKQEAIKYFKECLVLGYRNFVHIEEDSDLDAIRDMQEFKNLIAKYRKEKIKNLFNKLP